MSEPTGHLGGDAPPDPSDLLAEELAIGDGKLHACNRAAHRLARAFLDFRDMESGMVETYPGLEAAARKYERSVRAVASEDRTA